MPSPEPSPRPSALLPWSVEGPFPGERPTRNRDGFPAYANIVNRVGVYVSQNLRPDVAALIVDAVNERDRLRAALSHVRNVLRDEPMTKAQAENQARFIDAVLGEGETPTGKGVR